MRNSARIVLAFASGVTLGAVAGILFAPDTGHATRAKLSYQLDRYLVKLRELVGDKTGPISDVGGPTNANDISRADRKKAEELLREVESLLEDIKQKPHSGV